MISALFTQPHVFALTLLGTGLFFLLLGYLSGSRAAEDAREVLLVFPGLPLGCWGLAVAAENLWLGLAVPFSAYVLIGLGIILLCHALTELHWATLISVLVAGGVSLAGWYFLGSFLPWWVFIVVGLALYGLLSLILHLADLLIRAIDVVSFPSVVLYLAGLVGAAEGALALVGLSLSRWF